MFEPITLDELNQEIADGEKALEHNYEKPFFDFWQLIKIIPEKWKEDEYGGSNGFWVVGIYGKNVLWYNDYEEGFNVSTFDQYGVIKNCAFEQFDLNQIVYQIFNGFLPI